MAAILIILIMEVHQLGQKLLNHVVIVQVQVNVPDVEEMDGIIIPPTKETKGIAGAPIAIQITRERIKGHVLFVMALERNNFTNQILVI